MNLKNITAAQEAFRALDLSAENARIAEIEAEIARGEAAIERAEARRTEIARLMAGIEPDGRAVADSLLSGADVREAVAEQILDQRALQAERETLRVAARELRDRSAVLQAEIDQVRGTVRQRIAGIVAPIVADIMASMRTAAESLASDYGALLALYNGSGGFTDERMRAAEAVAGLTGHGRLLPQRDAYNAPPEIARLFDALADKGAAWPVGRR